MALSMARHLEMLDLAAPQHQLALPKHLPDHRTRDHVKPPQRKLASAVQTSRRTATAMIVLLRRRYSESRQ